MSWTKRQFVSKAFSSIGFANYVFDLQPEQLEDALSSLDSMMAMWNSKGIRLGYPLPSSPADSSLDQESNVPDAANMAIWSNLAITLAADVGKVVTPSLAMTARDSFRALSTWTKHTPQMQLSKMPLGAGNKPDRTMYRQFTQVQDTLDVGNDSVLEL